VGTGGAVKLQANKVIIHSVENMSFRLIGELYIPFQKHGELKSADAEINIPVFRTGMVKQTFWKETA
jgi:hypothetical protein